MPEPTFDLPEPPFDYFSNVILVSPATTMSGQQQPNRYSSYQGNVKYVPMMSQYGPDPVSRRTVLTRVLTRTMFDKHGAHGFLSRQYGAPMTDGPVRTKRPHAELTFAGLTNDIKGLVIGHGGAIQKLLTGHAEKKLAFRLRYYKIEDDVDSFFKIVMGGEPQDVLLAQEFVFKLISTSHKRVARNMGLVIDGVYPWKYIPGDHCFVIQYGGKEWHQTLPAMEDLEARLL